MGIHLDDLHAVLAAQLLLVGGLHTRHAHIVARAVFGIALDVILVHLADIPQKVAADLARILAHGAVDGIEAREVALLEAQLHLLRDIVQDQRRRSRAHTGITQHRFEFLAFDAHNVAETRRVETLASDIAVDHHQVVTLLALYQILAAAVDNLAARSILHLVPQHVARSQTLVFRVYELDIAYAQCQHGKDAEHHRPQYPASYIYVIVSHNILPPPVTCSESSR